MLRAAKPISACAALAFRRSVSAAKALSGFVTLIHRPNVPVLIPDETIVSISEPRVPDLPPPTLQKKESEWEQRLKAMASLTEEEIVKILPGWSIEIRIFESPSIRCHEFVLRAETPEQWSWNRHGDDGRIVEGLPRQVWGARLPVCDREISYARDSAGLMQHILGRLCEFARDIKCKAPVPEIQPAWTPTCRV